MDTNSQFSFSGTVSKILYSDAISGYCVFVLKSNNPALNKKVVTGTMFNISHNIDVEGIGEVFDSPKYGRQIKSSSLNLAMPKTEKGLINYLSSNIIKGVGPTLAKKIVKHFGLDTINIIEHDIERLSEVKGIGEKALEALKLSWGKYIHMKNIMLFLKEYDISTSCGTKIYSTYGDKASTILKSNPYRLADDIPGVGFLKADEIALKMGISPNSDLRLKSAIIYVLNQICNAGHVYATLKQLVSGINKLMECDAHRLYSMCEILVGERKLVVCEDNIYLPHFYAAENNIVKRLSLMSKINVRTSQKASNLILETEQKNKFEYDPIQKTAIETAMSSMIMIMTGGPGTGKTTTTLGIINVFKSDDKKILLAAPTGRAAKRLSDVTGMKAKTIHRLLEYNPERGYGRDETNPLSGDVLIVDEFSMVDVLLMSSLLKALPKNMRLIIVGDVDQLPSVGSGMLLKDLIASECFPVVRLKTVFRQAQHSKIIMNAHAINHGICPDCSNTHDGDFFFIEENNESSISNDVVNLVTKRLPAFYGIGENKIQVLTPMVKGSLGTKSLNDALQSVINPGGMEIRRNGVAFREGDRVMQTVNDYHKNVYNGDVGKIISVNIAERTLSVAFDTRVVEYEFSDIDNLTLAYAVTVHKSQGSEYPIVVIPLHESHSIMLQRNLLYTGVTRAKRICVVVGSRSALIRAVKNNEIVKRNTQIRQKLMSLCEKGTMMMPCAG